MRKVIILSFVLVFIMGASLACAVVASAAPNVASLSNRGSVLIFPLVDTQNGARTFIKIGNDANAAVDLKCYWVKVDGRIAVAPDCEEALGEATLAKLPPQQAPTDFVLELTRNQAVMFDAATGSNDGDPRPVRAAPFGSGIGYLACWAVDANNAQINWNFLTGQAIVVDGMNTPGRAIEYNAYTIGARSGSQGAKVGPAGTLVFDAKSYDSMPLYLTYNFPAVGFDGFVNLDLFLLQGSQNFKTMTKAHHVTKANFSVWNENETPFSGVSTCAWCYKETFLTSLNNGNFMTWFGLGSSVGRLRVQGVNSAACAPDLTDYQIERCMTAGTSFTPYATGLLAVAVQQWDGRYMVDPGNTGGQILTDSFVFDPTQP